MLPLRYARAWLAVGVALLVLGLASALAPASSDPPFTLNDKLAHLVGFLFFMLWFGGLFEARRAPFVALGLMAYGLLIEALQSLTPTRHAEGLDVVADAAGILLGWLLGAAGMSRWCLRLEQWLASRIP